MIKHKVGKSMVALVVTGALGLLLSACGPASSPSSSNGASSSGTATTNAANKTNDVITSKFKEVTRVEGKVFGTFYYITVPGGYPGGTETLQSDANFVFSRVASSINTFDESSELSRFNDFHETKPFLISDYLASIIEEMILQSRRIDQAMDPTVGPLVNMWGFGHKGEITKAPSDHEIEEAKSYVGLDMFSLRRAGNTAYLEKRDPRVELDLSTIGEGLAADEIASLLDEKGIENYMVAVAGAIRSKGANPEGKLWKVGIENPMNQGSSVFVPVCPQGMAISTAGSYRNFFYDEQKDKFFSHIIDPKTGRPIDHRTVSVSVIARQALITDALDTGLLVLGAKAAVDWGNRNDTAVYAIEINADGKPIATYSKSFAPYLTCKVDPNLATPKLAVPANISTQPTAEQVATGHN